MLHEELVKSWENILWSTTDNEEKKENIYY